MKAVNFKALDSVRKAGQETLVLNSKKMSRLPLTYPHPRPLQFSGDALPLARWWCAR